MLFFIKEFIKESTLKYESKFKNKLCVLKIKIRKKNLKKKENKYLRPYDTLQNRTKDCTFYSHSSTCKRTSEFRVKQVLVHLPSVM